MTLALLNDLNIQTNFEGNVIKVYPIKEVETKVMTVESDWSSASYFFSIVALSEIGTQITLSSYKQNSLQGDSSLVEIYKTLGVETVFENNSIILRKSTSEASGLKSLIWNLNSSPDIAQTIVVTSLGLGIGCHLTGLHTLKIKETDRLEALRIELTKLGATISVTNDSLTLEASDKINPNVKIATYNDHRMAMAFAPLALKVPINIENAEVVSKSYPDFWEDLKKIGFNIEGF
jgi:3-phosphoshikimate 1-carboxyvinyltransferase